MRLKLTDVTIQNLKPQHPQLDVWDTLLPSFGVRVGTKRKTFVVMYGTPRRRQVLGHWPATKLTEARDKARQILSGPFHNGTGQIQAADAIAEYIRTIQTRPRTRRDYDRLLIRYVPKKALPRITPRDILAVTDNLLHIPSECRHAHVAMQTFFNWCVSRYLQVSPMQGLKTPTKPNKRTRVLSYEELKAIWAASKQLGNFGVIIQLCILTLQRRSQIASAYQWTGSFTPSTSSIVFPASAVKQKQELVLPLSSRTRELFLSLRPAAIHWSKQKAKLDSLSGITEPYVIHDLRRCATHLNDLGIHPHVVERILGHAIPGVQGVYNRAQRLAEMQSALELWEAELVKRGVIT